ncbi:FXYD domain-containing ion transport regulator 3 isoform X1 [Orcinus orca]|uniref:FXYD domain-containing ion transport regulator 3 isoform X1 n=2 Tax=Orcinus orca TaxID=9733 RepID=UPI002111BCB7|nr:FXYD domain-containing ion transport regulator 3 isoform X1 [Orcinus orca]
MNAQIKTIPPGQLSDMQEVALSLLVLLAGLPALDANDPEDKNSPFYYDWFSLRVGGLIFAAVLCAIGIIVLMITIQAMPHLSSLQALPITVEDGSAERAPRATLSPSPGSAQDPKLQDGILRPPGQGSISSLTGGGLCSIFTLK